MNKKILIIILFILSFAFAALADDYSPKVINFPIGTTAAGAAATSTVYIHVPRNILVTHVYLSDQGTITASSTNYMTVFLNASGSLVAGYTSSGTALVAQAPTSLTAYSSTSFKVQKDTVLSAGVTKTAGGFATTLMNVSMEYIDGWK